MLKILKGLRMNSTIQIIKNHRSIRNYLEKGNYSGGCNL